MLPDNKKEFMQYRLEMAKESIDIMILLDLTDIDIMVLIDEDTEELRNYNDQLSDVSTEIALKYLKVFSITDVNYKEYTDWKNISPFYKNVSEEGVVLYAA